MRPSHKFTQRDFERYSGLKYLIQFFRNLQLRLPQKTHTRFSLTDHIVRTQSLQFRHANYEYDFFTQRKRYVSTAKLLSSRFIDHEFIYVHLIMYEHSFFCKMCPYASETIAYASPILRFSLTNTKMAIFFAASVCVPHVFSFIVVIQRVGSGRWGLFVGQVYSRD